MRNLFSFHIRKANWNFKEINGSIFAKPFQPVNIHTFTLVVSPLFWYTRNALQMKNLNTWTVLLVLCTTRSNSKFPISYSNIGKWKSFFAMRNCILISFPYADYSVDWRRLKHYFSLNQTRAYTHSCKMCRTTYFFCFIYWRWLEVCLKCCFTNNPEACEFLENLLFIWITYTQHIHKLKIVYSRANSTSLSRARVPCKRSKLVCMCLKNT